MKCHLCTKEADPRLPLMRGTTVVGYACSAPCHRVWNLSPSLAPEPVKMVNAEPDKGQGEMFRE